MLPISDNKLKRICRKRVIHNETKYDIEHLATMNLLKKQLDRFDGDFKLPISLMGNLCLLPEK